MTGPGLDSLFLTPIHLFDNVFNKLLNLFHTYIHTYNMNHRLFPFRRLSCSVVSRAPISLHNGLRK